MIATDTMPFHPPGKMRPIGRAWISHDKCPDQTPTECRYGGGILTTKSDDGGEEVWAQVGKLPNTEGAPRVVFGTRSAGVAVARKEEDVQLRTCL